MNLDMAKALIAALAMIAAAATVAAAPQKKAGALPASGLMAKVPIKLGYYVNIGDTCSKPTSVMKFGPNGVWNIDADGAMETRFASVTREGAWYSLNFAGEWEEQDPQAILVQPKGPGRIGIQIQDDAEMKYCPPDQIPAKFRK